jgi:hypothetical protein
MYTYVAYYLTARKVMYDFISSRERLRLISWSRSSRSTAPTLLTRKLLPSQPTIFTSSAAVRLRRRPRLFRYSIISMRGTYIPKLQVYHSRGRTQAVKHSNRQPIELLTARVIAARAFPSDLLPFHPTTNYGLRPALVHH